MRTSLTLPKHVVPSEKDPLLLLIKEWWPNLPEPTGRDGVCDRYTWDVLASSDAPTLGRKEATKRSLDGGAHAREMHTRWLSTPVSKCGLKDKPTEKWEPQFMDPKNISKTKLHDTMLPNYHCIIYLLWLPSVSHMQGPTAEAEIIFPHPLLSITEWSVWIGCADSPIMEYKGLSVRRISKTKTMPFWSM